MWHPAVLVGGTSTPLPRVSAGPHTGLPIQWVPGVVREVGNVPACLFDAGVAVQSDG